MNVVAFPDFSAPAPAAPAPRLSPIAASVLIGTGAISQAGVALAQADFAALRERVAQVLIDGQRLPEGIEPERQHALETQIILFTAAATFFEVLRITGVAPRAPHEGAR